MKTYASLILALAVVVAFAPTGATAEGPAHVANVPFPNGSDLEFATIAGRDYAFAGTVTSGSSGGIRVIEITDPRSPTLVSIVPCRANQSDVQIRGTTLVIASDSSSSNCTRADGSTFTFIGFVTYDVSIPSQPKHLGIARISRGAHNLTLHPTEPLVYVSDGDLTGPGVLPIWDIADPSRPVPVTSLTYTQLHSPHDITFNATGTRAYAASITHTDIFDTSDARNPRLMTTFADPAITISHQADPTPDGRYLFVTDELGGGAIGPVCPGGGIHVYDLSVGSAPVKVGTFWIDDTGASRVCTAHVFRINPDGRTMSIAWYDAGVHVLDVSDVVKIAAAGSGALTGIGPRTIASFTQPNAQTWAAKMWPERHPGYVFANDLRRGFDVFFVPALA